MTGLFAAGLLLFFSKELFGTDKSKDAPASSTIPSGSAMDYIKKFKEFAKQSEKFYRVPAAFTLAQGGLESAWGTSNIVRNANNYFGIKADKSWRGPSYKGYRKYRDAAESFSDHAKFLTTNPRYRAAFDSLDPEQFTRAVAAAGYAEDPQYAQKIISLLKFMA